MYNKTDDQIVFDRVARHLLSQNKKSYSASTFGLCAYRSMAGLKCAIGVLISDSAYQAKVESKPATHKFVIDALEESGIHVVDRSGNSYSNYEQGVSADLLLCLQRIHDTDPVKDWPFFLAQLAVEKRLRYDVIREYPHAKESLKEFEKSFSS